MGVRELEKLASEQSFLPLQKETRSQFDSENRAVAVFKNMEKFRGVQETLNRIYSNAEYSGLAASSEKVGMFYTADEVLGKLTPQTLQSVQKAIHALGDRVNLTEFVHILVAFLPSRDWKDQTSMITNLCEVYDTLDIDGDGVVTWEEIFEFNLEMGRSSQTTHERTADANLTYHISETRDKRGQGGLAVHMNMKDGEIERLETLDVVDKIVVTEKESSVFKVYDVETLTWTDSLVGHKGAALRCLYLSGTDYIVTSASDSLLIVWGAYTFTQRQVLPCNQVLSSLAWDSYNFTLYGGSTDGNVLLFQVPRRNAEATGSEEIAILQTGFFRAHMDVVTDLVALPDLGLLVTSSLDSMILVWDLNTHKLRHTLDGHLKGVHSLAYIASQRYLISTSYDKVCKVWNPLLEEPLFNLYGHVGIIVGLRVVVGSEKIITSDVEGFVKVGPPLRACAHA